MKINEAETPEGGRRRKTRSRSHRNSANKVSVPLYKRSSSHFQREEQERGADCYRDGGVRLEIESPRARAGVVDAGDGAYRVGIDWSRVARRRLHTFCECTRFSGGKFCRHVWATLLALADSGAENQPAGKDRLGVRRDRAASWADLGVAPRADEASQAALSPGIDRSRGGKGGAGGRAGRQRAVSSSARRGRGPAASWRSQLALLRDEVGLLADSFGGLVTPTARPAALDVRFFINPKASMANGSLVLDVFESSPMASGKAGKLKRSSVPADRLEKLLLPSRNGNGNGSLGDAEPARTLTFIGELSGESTGRKKQGSRGAARQSTGVRRLRLPAQLYDSVLPHLSAQNRLGWWDGRVQKNLYALSWDGGAPWHLVLHLEIEPSGSAKVKGGFERDDESVALSDAVLILTTRPSESTAGPSLVVFPESVGRLQVDAQRDLPWLNLLRDRGEVVIPRRDLEEALTELLELPALPRLEIPEELQLEEEGSTLQPRLALEKPSALAALNPPLVADLSFDYGPVRVSAEDPRSAIVDWQEQTLLRRNLEREHSALVRLLELGVKPLASSDGNARVLGLDAADLPAVIEPLLMEGWSIEVQGHSVRSPGPAALRVESGIDWFDLSGEVEFAGDRLELSTVLGAVSRGDRFVRLADGSQGLLPVSWMETYGSLSQLASDSTDEGLRFLPSQALLVDALLSAMPPADVDSAFAKLRDKLASFSQVRPRKEPRSFVGTLRTYQRQGLGWLHFLRDFGLGGVLADDMGLGKTVQVLALIQTYRAPSKTTKLPFLVVAPRSVVYNWIDEASRFTPKLRVAEYRGTEREELRPHFSEYDILVTTYATLRRDISFLAKVEFDTVILDEAQAIKNAASQTAKASRLLNARHRLALTGTPIENHLGELGSIFEFVNPGLLGRLPRLQVLMGGRAPSKQELEHIARDMRPFILRRTKAQVLPDLPPKTEQTLLCNLHPAQREIYDRLRASYQASLMEEVETKGVSGVAIQVLAALLRLRQVACHPGLVDEQWAEAGSAKLDTLMDQVAEVLDEGHKVLVFSQFTKLLGFVKERLDAEDVSYAYLDGKTRDRAAVVERFQNDEDCNLFLISLKAGGLGLNLTAAGYVFLLDPWWNPAVEAQAIDRTHRIGQTEPVFAYRMIARDTVEEKILELQNTKRKLADAILEGEGKSLRDLTADDLKLLLS